MKEYGQKLQATFERSRTSELNETSKNAFA